MQIHDLKSPSGSRKRKKIVGRGRGSGRGKTSGRGENGQNSRSTGRALVGSSEGGQMPLIRRLPKVGFRSKRPILNQIVNIGALDKFEDGTVVNAEFLKTQGLINSLNKPVKILGSGKINKKLVIRISSISQSARKQIIAAGGSMEEPLENITDQEKDK